MNKIVIFKEIEDPRKSAIVDTLIEEAQLWLDFNGYHIGTVHLEDALEELKEHGHSRPLSIAKTKVEEACLWAGISTGEVIEPRVRSIIKTLEEKIELWESTLK